jgi:hypothetical protein
VDIDIDTSINVDDSFDQLEYSASVMMERNRSTFTPFKKGDRVWLDTRHLKTSHHKKIAPRREGPFEITEVIGPVTYQIDLPPTWKVHNVFHATLL